MLIKYIAVAFTVSRSLELLIFSVLFPFLVLHRPDVRCSTWNTTNLPFLVIALLLELFLVPISTSSSHTSLVIKIKSWAICIITIIIFWVIVWLLRLNLIFCFHTINCSNSCGWLIKAIVETIWIGLRLLHSLFQRNQGIIWVWLESFGCLNCWGFFGLPVFLRILLLLD